MIVSKWLCFTLIQLEFQFLNRRSTSTAGLRLFGKTCELRMLDRLNRTCAAGLRNSVRPANCKRSPLTGLQVPNIGIPAEPFLFFFLFRTTFHTTLHTLLSEWGVAVWVNL